jgi:chloride channel protein, CIC family
MPRPKGLPLRAFAIFLLAAGIGVAGGALGSVFQRGLDWIQHTLTGGSGADLSQAVHDNLTWWQTVLVPTAGGFAAGLLLLFLRGQRPPFGVADLVGLVQLRKGILRFRQSLVQILSSACTIGSGGSIGREGANSQIAATVASIVARVTRLGSRQRAVLLGCGVAAGMATSYNAPIAGAIFCMEVVLGNFAMDVFAPIVVAAVLATIVRSNMSLLGERAIYATTAEVVAKLPWHLVLAALVLGLFCGVGGVLFRKALAIGKDVFKRLRLWPPLALAAGGAIVGAIGIHMPETWGNGFEVIDKLAGAPALTLVLSLCVWKLVATVATVGSGGLGGIFTPNMVIGAAFGTLFATCIAAIAPISPREQSTFAFVGMAGLVAATMHAPVTAVVLVFELTGHYELTLPVMLCSIVASITASLIDEDSYYTAAMKAKGDAPPSGLEEMAIRTTYVRDVVRRDCLSVPQAADFREVMRLLGGHRDDTLYVVDEQGSPTGRIELQDLKSFLNDPALTRVVIAADLTRPVVTATPDQSIAAVMPHFEDAELREVAVVEAQRPNRLIGRIRHRDVLSTLGMEVLGSQRRNLRSTGQGHRETIELPAGYELRTLPVPDDWVGLACDALPATSLRGVVLLLVVRADGDEQKTFVATPEVVLQTGDEVVVLGKRAALSQFQYPSED